MAARSAQTVLQLGWGRRRQGFLQPRLASVGWSQVARAATETDAMPTLSHGERKLRSQEELPGPSVLGSLYWIFVKGYITRLHELQIIHKKMYGPLWRSKFGPYMNINIASAQLMEEVLRQEGKYPMRSDMAAWKEHRDQRNWAYGPFTEEGKQWHHLRSILNQRMLKPKEAALYIGAINEVVSDLIQKLYYLRETSQSGVMVRDLTNELYQFTFEGIAYILFETRIGCLQKKIPPKTQEFIDAIGCMMKTSAYVTLIPKWAQNLFPYWERYIEAWDTIFNFAKTLIDKKMENIQARLERGEKVEGEYLTYLLSSDKLNTHEVYGSIPELLLAGVDTTSNTLSWALYHLAKDQEIQSSLYKEVIDVIPEDRLPGIEDIQKMPLLKAVIKETLRLYPVVPSNARIGVEKEIVVRDFCFPKMTMFHLCHFAISHDETEFPEPYKFIPERWFRDKGMMHHPFGSIPFGYGVRACLGRRIAELEMYVSLIRIMKVFEVKPDPNGGEVTAISRITMAPGNPINLQFIERSSTALP
ncbi:sterol 26-hydroxylase, mitochondrial-like isoform X1 [Latimeria chalumnae]|uniref:sterol 26-hydroxylase, mitochondrial-like isoform X1 n=1 Tax=Latimeria chalumnae TaxID=7897 RepID=UPI0003C16FCF|nr:PREDICTED: sterol 26-hydroxylase, mitochondrial-like isoform X1 [Latimeria chalumnae]|eukprot:XP_005991816.1 PREDICTED: sterol 26-hydroxylase, mitochondrial-like isoform X1 [Latimeria chalumnae]